MSMQEAVTQYYSKLKEYTLRKKGTLPKTGWDSRWNQEIYISGPDSNEKAEWKPVYTAFPDSRAVPAEKLGFLPSAPMLEYFFSCCFPQLRGSFGGIDFSFAPVGVKCGQAESAVNALKMAAAVPGREKVFYLGNASLDGDDELSVYYDDARAELFLAGCDRKEPVILKQTPAEIIGNMEAY